VTEGYLPAEPGIRLFYQKVGDGPNPVIVPNAHFMVGDFSRLAEGRTLVFVDWRNRGRSDAVSDREALRRGVHHDVEDIEAVRRHFGFDRVSVIAHSYSCVTAVLYAIQRPQRLNRLVMIGPTPPSPGKEYPSHLKNEDETFQRFLSEFRKLQGERGSMERTEFCKRAWALLRLLYVAEAADADKLHWEPCDAPNELAFMKHWTENIQPSIQALNLTADQIRQVHCPVLAVHGRRDRSSPYGGGREWAELLPTARLLTVDEGAHVPWIEAPDAVFGAIETFLTAEFTAHGT
jgi:pimeloyl-ACP methyl ester carboxylesterase